MKLANDQAWQFIATMGTDSWVKRLALTMELEPCELDVCSKLIFVTGKENIASIQESVYSSYPNERMNLPELGWSIYDLYFIKLWFHNNFPDVICDIGAIKSHNPKVERMLDIWRFMCALYPVYQRAQRLKGLPIHAALLEWNGMGVLLSAPGGTGKSTCCQRIPSPWRALCDDETLVIPDKNRQYFAHPFPTWGDLFDQVKKHGKLRDIFRLRLYSFWNNPKMTRLN